MLPDENGQFCIIVLEREAQLIKQSECHVSARNKIEKGSLVNWNVIEVTLNKAIEIYLLVWNDLEIRGSLVEEEKSLYLDAVVQNPVKFHPSIWFN